MDTSEKYIEMCHKADEIQKQWAKEEGDVFAAGEHTCKDFTHAKLVTGMVYEHIPFNYKCGCCGRNYYAETWWLPRQDQLQEMTSIEKPLTFTLTGTDECSVYSKVYHGSFHFTDKS